MALCLVLKTAAPLEADLYVDFEAGSNGNAMTEALMDAGTKGGSGWWDNGTGHIYVSTDASHPLYGGVKVGGTTYDGSGGTRGFKFDPEGVTDVASFGYNFAEPLPANVSFGSHFKSTSSTTDGLSIVAGVTATNYDYNVSHWTSSGGQPALHINSNDTGPIVIAPNTWYWVTAVYRAGGMRELSVYLAADGSLVGHTQVAAVGNANVTLFNMGRTGSDAAAGSGQWCWDNLVINLSGVFPLVPSVWG